MRNFRLNNFFLLGLIFTWSWPTPCSRANDLVPLATLSADGDALNGVTAAAFVPSASGTEPRLATVGADKILRIWSWRDGKLLQSWPGLSATALQLVASPDGKVLVAGWEAGEGKTRDAGVRIWSMADGQSKVVSAPDVRLERITFWPDAKTLAVQGQQKAPLNSEPIVLLYDVAGGALRKSLRDHYAIAFDAKQGTLLEAHYNSRTSRDLPGLARWTLATGDMEAALLPFSEQDKLRGMLPTLGQAAVSTDATRLAVLSNDRSWTARMLQMFGMAPLRPLWTIYPLEGASQGSFSNLAFAGRLLLTQSGNTGVTIWDSGGGDLLATLPANTTVLSTSSDGRFLAVLLKDSKAGAAQPRLQIWDMDRFKPLNERQNTPVKAGVDGARTLQESDLDLGGVHDVAFSRDGKTLVSTQGNLLVNWDAQSGARLHTHSGTGGTAALAVSPDGRWVLSASGSDNTARLWDGRTLSFVRELGQHEWGMNVAAFSPDSRLAFAAGSGLTGESGRHSKGLISVWEAATGKKLKSLVNSSDRVQSLTISPDGKLLANGNFQTGIDIWSVATFLSDPDPFGGKPDSTIQSNGTGHNALTFSADGKTLFAATPKGLIEVFDIATKKSLLSWQTGDEAYLRSLVLSPDGKKLATVSGPDTYPKPPSPDGIVKIWDATTGKLLRTLQTPGVAARGGAWKTTPTGTTLAIGLADGSIKLWAMN